MMSINMDWYHQATARAIVDRLRLRISEIDLDELAREFAVDLAVLRDDGPQPVPQTLATAIGPLEHLLDCNSLTRMNRREKFFDRLIPSTLNRVGAAPFQYVDKSHDAIPYLDPNDL